MMTYNKTRTYTLLNINIKILKRFYPGGNQNPIGHVKKIMNLIKPMNNTHLNIKNLTNNNTLKKTLPNIEIQNLNNPLTSQQNNIVKNKQLLSEQVQQSNLNTSIQESPEILSQDNSNLVFNGVKAKEVFNDTVQNISGLASFSENHFQEIFNNNLIFKICLKISHCIFVGEPIKDLNDLILKINLCLQNDTILQTGLYYTLTQHILVSIFANIKIDPKILTEITKGKIDYTSFENQPTDTLTIIEAFTANYTLKPLLMKNNLRFSANNYKKLSKKAELEQQVAIKQMQQPNPDFKCTAFFKCENENNIEKFYFYDVKLIMNPLTKLKLFKGYLSLITQLKPIDEYMLFNKRYGDLSGIVNEMQKDINYKSNNILIKTLDNYSKQMQNVLKDKKLTINEKILEGNKIMNKMDSDKNLKYIINSRIVATEPSILFENFIKDNSTYTEQEFSQIISKIDPLKIIPTAPNTAPTGAVQEIIFKIIKSLPEQEKNQALINWHRFKLLENANDLF